MCGPRIRFRGRNVMVSGPVGACLCASALANCSCHYVIAVLIALCHALSLQSLRSAAQPLTGTFGFVHLPNSRTHSGRPSIATRRPATRRACTHARSFLLPTRRSNVYVLDHGLSPIVYFAFIVHIQPSTCITMISISPQSSTPGFTSHFFDTQTLVGAAIAML